MSITRHVMCFILALSSCLLSRAQETPAATAVGRYAEHSVLREGNWAKIRVSESGVYQLTDALLRSCGFSDPKRVKIYGYGGALQPESLTGEYLQATDDLNEVPTCTTAEGQRLFYAVGPVTWDSATSTIRTRNPYSDYGYYFLTENDAESLTLSEEQFNKQTYPAVNDYHSLYEVDNYAWFHGGRMLFDQSTFNIDQPRTFRLKTPGKGDGTLSVALSYDAAFKATISVCDSIVGEMFVNPNFDTYTKAAVRTETYNIPGPLPEDCEVKITLNSGSMRLDYLTLTTSVPLPRKTAGWPTPEFVHRITNQDHHADTAVDMVIIIPTSQQWLSQAQRLQALHAEKSGLTTRIIPADELYNEFSSGTPDATAYRRYLKMLYDRATTDAEKPRYLLLFGDGAWDNRMLSSNWKGYNPDNFLLCFESENSFSEVHCFVSDDFFCMLDDKEQIQQKSGSSLTYLGQPDVAVGRLTARSLADATILVDKIESYMNNAEAGNWQNTIFIMGDDGNNNSHMATADRVATMIEQNYSGYNIKKVYWDAYERVSSSTGNSYPDATRLIKQQMSEGALIMNYSGHGAAYSMSHEAVLNLADFSETTSLRLPLWLTASCDIMPFDGQEENIGETAMLNERGGSIAFFGTTRTVYANYNEMINLTFTRYVLGTDENGRRISIGEAARRAKCDLVRSGRDTSPNKLQYTLLGDPALVLAAPTLQVVVDSINGQPVNSDNPTQLSAGSIVSVSGHVSDAPSMRGIITATIKDAEEQITCRLNNRGDDGAETAFVYNDRTKTIYQGSDSLRSGRFKMTFAVPKDISYTDGVGLMTLYAVSNDHQLEAHGENADFVLNGRSTVRNDSIGPSIHCYLNSPSFTNGGKTHATPYFVAELYDDNGINASGSSVGHDLELIIDGEMQMTYNLNSYFVYDFGDYRRGSLGFSIPTLDYGHHTLLFRAWDVLNNSSTAELSFEVARGITPNCLDLKIERNITGSGTLFTITHDRAGCELQVTLDIFDTAGRQLYKHTEKGTPQDHTYQLQWNGALEGGQPLMSGVYICRVSISSEGSGQSSKAKKLLITN